MICVCIGIVFWRLRQRINYLACDLTFVVGTCGREYISYGTVDLLSQYNSWQHSLPQGLHGQLAILNARTTLHTSSLGK